MKRMIWLVALGLFLGACSGGDDELAPTTTPPTSESPGDTSSTADPAPSDQAATGVTSHDVLTQAYTDADGLVTPELALTAFSLQFGDVPGSMGLERDGSQSESGTGALQWVMRVWDELSNDQQTAVQAAIDKYAGLESGNAAPGDGINAVTALAATGTRFLAARAAVSDEEQATWDAMAAEAERTIQARLGGVDLVYDLVLVPSVEGGDAETGPTTTLLFDFARLSNDSCRIAVGEARFFAEESKRISAITHEMFHCWSIMNSISILAWHVTPPWYQEGVAAWVGESIAGGSSYSASWWPNYLQPPRSEGIYPLYHRSYSAIGFWSSVDASLGGDLWSKIPNLNTIAGGGVEELLMASVVTMIGDDGLASIPAVAALRSDWGANWIFSGPGITATPRPANEITIAPGSPDGVSVSPGWQQLESFALALDASTSATLVEVTGSGWLSARWNTGEEFTIVGSAVERFCIGECTCEDGSSPAGEATPLSEGANTLAVGLIGGPTTGSAAQVSMSAVEEECPEPSDPVDPGSPFDAASFVGTWQATAESIVDMFNNSFAYELAEGFPPLTVIGVSGDMNLILTEAQVGKVTYDNLQLVLDETAPFPALTLNGSGGFHWHLEGFEMVFDQVNEFNITATADILGEATDFPISNTDIVAPDGESRFVYLLEDDSRLVLSFSDATNGRVFFPHNWRRAE